MALVPSSLLAVDFGSWFARVWTEHVVPRWEAFRKVFVGEDLLIQLLGAGGALALAYVVTLGMRPLLRRVTHAIEERDDWIEEAIDWVSDNIFRLLVASLLWSVSLYLDAVSEKNYILVRGLASVATLWLVSGALPSTIKKQVYFKTLFFVLAVGLILNLLGIWSVIQEGLDAIRLFPISDSGETSQVTVYTLVKGVIAVMIVIPLAGWLIRTSESRVGRMQNVSPALRVLVVKMLKVVVAATAILFAISSMGVNLSAFAVLGGALGLGLGFGFQKVVSNLISGVILLGDKSIKPGDVIEVDDTYGWINTLGARYTSVITRDGTEHLIPNEMMITEKVVNWSFSDDKVRVKVPFGVSYNSDIHKAMELALQAANEDSRILQEPNSVVRLVEYGDNSVNFELRAWIRDPASGIGNIRSSFYIRIWDLFKEGGIEFPYPQRDVHLKDLPPVEVRVRKDW